MPIVKKEKLFLGIDLGGKEKKTTGVCILEEENGNLVFNERYCKNCSNIFGKNIFKKIGKYLKDAKVIAIDAPLTKGRGRGKMRLYEKFLSTKTFRKEKVSPLPPALMPKLCNFAFELVEKLEKRGFVLDLNLIETFPTLVEKICKKDTFSYSPFCKNENQRSAFICAMVAYLHSNFKTRYLGYKDGFLFLPEMSFWKKEWRKKFFQAWYNKPRFRYKYLKTNIFKY